MLLQTLMDNLNSIQNPMIGDPDGHIFVTSPVNDFQDGGVRFNAKNELLAYKERTALTSHIDASAGTFIFDMKPLFLASHNEKLAFFSRRDWTNPLLPGLMEFGLHNNSNFRRLRFVTMDANGNRSDQTIELADWEPHLPQNVWKTIRITWNWKVPVQEQCVHIYVNNIELPITKWELNGQMQIQPAMTGPQTTVESDENNHIIIGNRDTVGFTYRANAVIRNFRIHEDVI